MILVLFLVAVINTLTKSTFGRKGFLWLTVRERIQSVMVWKAGQED